MVKEAEVLADQGVNVDVYSVTSWSELVREGRATVTQPRSTDTAACLHAAITMNVKHA